MRTLSVFSFFFLLTAGICVNAEIVLVKDGKPCAEIIRPRGSPVPALFAGLELRDYTERMTGARLPRLREPGTAKYKVYIVMPDQKGVTLPAKARELLKKTTDDGFVLYTENNTLYVTAKNHAGLNYGTYEILKRYGGIRWISPGKEGEFVPEKKDLIIPDLACAVNPSFKHRNFNLVSAYGYRLTPLWQMRNGMSQHGIMYGGKKQLGGHIFSTLLPDTLFPSHPEYFCLCKGKRTPQCGTILSDPSKYKAGGQKNQPCTSNPEVVRIMCENLVKMLKAHPEAEAFCILNNDSTQWCECENCRKLDPPEEKKRGRVSTRFWLLANALIDAGKKAAPHVSFFASPYQNFQEYPEGVKPHPEAEINFCLHHRCYLHSIGDPKCQTNERYRRILGKWHTEKRKVRTYEYTDILPRETVWYLPLASLLADDLRWYKKIGNDGWCDEVAPYDGTFVAKFDDRTSSERWIGNALDLYITARFLWDVNLDYDAVENEGGKLYYGKAWPAMKKYRKLLYEAYRNINDHFCYGSKLWQLGRFAQYPELHEKLKAELQKAKTLAKGDPRVEKIVARDAEFYELSFEAAMKEFNSAHTRKSVHAAALSKNDPEWLLADWATAGTAAMKFAWTPEALLLRLYPCGRYLPGDQLEITMEETGRKITVPAEAGKIIRLPLQRKGVEGESAGLGIVLIRKGARYSWNGNSTSAPGFFRKVHFGNDPFYEDGSFEDVTKDKDGKLVPRSFKPRYTQRVVCDGTAASGEYFLRGHGMILHYLYGLRGHKQTYGITKDYDGKIRVRIKYRGKGKAAVTLKTANKLIPIGGGSFMIDSPAWQEKEYVFDCAEYPKELLLLYFFTHADTLDMDDIRIEKADRTEKALNEYKKETK